MNQKLLRIFTILLLITVFVGCRGNQSNSDSNDATNQPAQTGSVIQPIEIVEVPTPAPDSNNPDLVQPDPPDPDTPSESGTEGDEVGSGNAVETNADGTQAAVEDDSAETESTDDAATETSEAATEGSDETSSEGSAEANVHIIEDGESISYIAETYDVSADVLAIYNEIDDVDSIAAGDSINIPSAAIVAAIERQIEQAAEAETTEADSEDEAEEVATEETAEESEEEVVAEEEEAVVEESVSDSAETTYTVQSGNGLAYIAIDYGVDIDDLAAANNLANYDDIYVGQVLIIPGVSNSDSVVEEVVAEEVDEEEVDESDSAESEPIYHTIVFGDKLDNIAEFYGVSMQSIIDANDIEDADLIKLDQVLLIPSE